MMQLHVIRPNILLVQESTDDARGSMFVVSIFRETSECGSSDCDQRVTSLVGVITLPSALVVLRSPTWVDFGDYV